jgi:hypothetical protein
VPTLHYSILIMNIFYPTQSVSTRVALTRTDKCQSSLSTHRRPLKSYLSRGNARHYDRLKTGYCGTNQFRVMFLGRTLPHQAPLDRNAPGHPESSGPVVKSIRFRIVAHNPEAGRSNRPPATHKNAVIYGVFCLQAHLALTPARTAGRLWRG